VSALDADTVVVVADVLNLVLSPILALIANTDISHVDLFVVVKELSLISHGQPP
jgi:hypothetical protein